MKLSGKIIFAAFFLTIVAGVFSLSSEIHTAQKETQREVNLVATLERRVALLEANSTSTASTASSLQASLKDATELVRPESVRQKSQEDLLTAAVAAVAPTVVSIVITKEVPHMDVVFENPFGDDPFFKDFNIRMPRFVQHGSETKKIGAGTGFLVSGNGFIVTNRHVVEDTEAHYTVLLSTGTQKEARVVYRDPAVDIAIISIQGDGFKYAIFGNSEALKLGQSVFAVGNALGEFNNSISVGVISGLNRSIEAMGRNETEQLSGVIQTDAAINPGNSGGPLVDLNGNVIGVNVATAQGGQNIGFSIPSSIVKKVIAKVLH